MDGTDEILTKLNDKHGKVAHILIEDRLYVFKKPKAAQYKRMAKEIERDALTAAHNLLLGTMVYPEDGRPAAMNWLADEYPAALPQVANKLADMAGASIQVEVEGN